VYRGAVPVTMERIFYKPKTLDKVGSGGSGGRRENFYCDINV